MPIPDKPMPEDQGLESGMRRLLVRDGWPAAGLAAATVAVELGVYGLGRAGGAGPLGATLATLAAAAVWAAVAAPICAAGARTALGALLRGCVVADASAVTLLTLWRIAADGQGRPYLTLPAAVKVYLILAAMALAAVAAVRCARTRAGRAAMAVLAAAVGMAALATPLWVNGLLAWAPRQYADTLAAWAVLANPFYSITSAVAERTGFTWHSAPILYGITRIGDSVAPPPAAWYAAAWRYAVVAAILAAVAWFRGCPWRPTAGAPPGAPPEAA